MKYVRPDLIVSSIALLLDFYNRSDLLNETKEKFCTCRVSKYKKIIKEKEKFSFVTKDAESALSMCAFRFNHYDLMLYARAE